MTEILVHPDNGLIPYCLGQAWNFRAPLLPSVPKIKQVGRTNVPSDWIPDLVQSQGLAIIIPYVSDFERALLEGPKWKLLRGTKPGVELGISWVETGGTQEPGDQRHGPFDFQIRFEEPIKTLETMRKVDGIVRLSKSTPTNPFRYFNAPFDIRPIRADYHKGDQGAGDGYSGKQLWTDGPIISFGASYVERFPDREINADEIEEVHFIDLHSHADDVAESSEVSISDADLDGPPKRWGHRWPTGSWRTPNQPHAFDVISE